MHNFISAEQILAHGGTPTDTRVLDQSDSSVHHKECVSCSRIRPYNEFKRDSSYREGVRDQCLVCESSPRLSTEEHVARLQEQNYSRQEVKNQRWAHQLDYIDEEERLSGRWMHHSELLPRLRKIIPFDLFITDGRIIGDLAVYRVYGQPQPHLDGRDFQYLWYIPLGNMPELSTYEFDSRDVPVREKLRGWRTPLLRLIKSRLITEGEARKEFGLPNGPASVVYRRQLYIARNGHA